MDRQKINRISGATAVGLSLVALAAVVSGYFQRPHADEGSSAHVFQLAIVLLVPTVLALCATADWKERTRVLRPLAVSATSLVIAFGALFYLEHYWFR
jgi:hypothetical protein